ncbi:hypothetical protein [Rhodocista pekingensis]|uniref:Uncharacterized protein n=1 Tax=Rhodocista pekingensis TaxID=201185 RepID=A0ABW2KYC3_9PROT
MLPFATEFPISNKINREIFVNEAITWLQGIKGSTVLSSNSEQDFDIENATIRSNSGEEFRLRELKIENSWEAIGFRHDNPDNLGRVWRTEAVLKRRASIDSQHLVRIRTQCIARTPDAHLEIPRKPYFIKTLIKNNFGGMDLNLKITDSPIWLDESEECIETARAATLGAATEFLPVVYISAKNDGGWLLNEKEIERLAFDLGGVAHVLVEPSRMFSFLLRDKCEGQNYYGGAVGIIIPGKGTIRRLLGGWQFQNSGELSNSIKRTVIDLRGRMPAIGWDWTELQEQTLRLQRDRDRHRLTAEESERLYEEEIENLKDEILELRQQIEACQIPEISSADQNPITSDNIVRILGPEIYNGEIMDRLRFLARVTQNSNSSIDIDDRSKIIFKILLERISTSPALDELRQDLDRATKNPKRVSDELTSLLSRHGYRKKNENKHIRMEAADQFEGLASITVPKTPSDTRGLTNLRKEIERKLGITRLHD